MADFDVLIAGAGPAGCATSLALADFAPELQVGLIDPGREGTQPIGETVPPQIEPLLAHLGLRDRFLRSGHCPSYRTMAAWGDARLGSNEFLLQSHQTGWRLDRAVFDRMFLDAALDRGTTFFKAKATNLTPDAPGWNLSLSDGSEHRARFVVDATGNAATLARQRRVPQANVDRLIGCSLAIAPRGDGTEGLVVETFPEGWWYTVAIPGGGRIVACMTDADRVQPLNLLHEFPRLLAATRHVRRVAEIPRCPTLPTVWPASSRLFDVDPALPLLCVGDSGSRYDPISGQGIFKALRSGVFASYAIADYLCRGLEWGLSRYCLMLKREFDAYRGILQSYYAQEQRWPESPFWQRRHVQR